MRKFTRYLEKKENNNVLDKIKEEIKMMLYNNKHLFEPKIKPIEMSLDETND